ncbi:hypothetical protein U0070_000056 [Myodes glareolus]|uniref:Uncharacterized protein n=1 Tax=Myodes glareolus TaxID=447135 RepID=A0AAW0I0L5_MYOGA
MTMKVVSLVPGSLIRGNTGFSAFESPGCRMAFADMGIFALRRMDQNLPCLYHIIDCRVTTDEEKNMERSFHLLKGMARMAAAVETPQEIEEKKEEEAAPWQEKIHFIREHTSLADWVFYDVGGGGWPKWRTEVQFGQVVLMAKQKRYGNGPVYKFTGLMLLIILKQSAGVESVYYHGPALRQFLIQLQKSEKRIKSEKRLPLGV